MWYAVRVLILFVVLVASPSVQGRRRKRQDVNVGSDGGCTTPETLPGQCINIKSCPVLLDMLQKRTEPGWREHLVKSQCGAKENNVTKVCCPSSPTPARDSIPDNSVRSPTPAGSVADMDFKRDGNCTTPRTLPGQCIDINACPVLLDMAQKRTEPGWIEYLYKSHCGTRDNNVTKVCCPSNQLPDNSDGSTTPAGDELPDTSVCGHSDPIDPSTHRVKRIVGGRPSVLGAWPWMAALGYSAPSKPLDWKCTGSLISNRHVLTAAHCLVELTGITLTVVRIGDLNLDDSVPDRATPTDVAVEKTIVPENYKDARKRDDIGLVVLKHRVEFTKLIRPICVPAPSTFPEDISGYTPFVTGWGKSGNGSRSTTAMQEAQLDITDHDVCANTYKNLSSRFPIIDNSMICAHSAAGKDTCQGDSGAPLMLQKKSIFYLIGLSSYGVVGCSRQVPSVYTKVSAHVDWIKRTMMNGS